MLRRSRRHYVSADWTPLAFRLSDALSVLVAAGMLATLLIATGLFGESPNPDAQVSVASFELSYNHALPVLASEIKPPTPWLESR